MREVEEYFVCEHCDKKHKLESAYEKCVLSHDIVYIGLERQEWKSLLMGILNAHNWGFPFDEKTVTKLLKYKVGVKR
jgi:hypothetical protein